MAQRCVVLTRPGHLPVVRAPGRWRTAGASLLSAPLNAERALGAKKRRHKGNARVGTPKTAGLGGRRWLARFWGTLARTTAGATLLPFCALPCYSISKTKIFVFSTAASHYRLDNGKWLEPDRAFATSLRLADNQGSLRGSGRSGEAGAACTPSRWATPRFTSRRRNRRMR